MFLRMSEHLEIAEDLQHTDMACSNYDQLACASKEVTMGQADGYDPDKIWVILHYPDTLKISHKMLSSLLNTLTSYPATNVSFN